NPALTGTASPDRGHRPLIPTFQPAPPAQLRASGAAGASGLLSPRAVLCSSTLVSRPGGVSKGRFQSRACRRLSDDLVRRDLAVFSCSAIWSFTSESAFARNLPISRDRLLLDSGLWRG